jgi:hypothetical protein
VPCHMNKCSLKARDNNEGTQGMPVRARADAAQQTVTSWLTFRRPRRCTFLTLAAAAAFMTMTVAGASSYRPSPFPLIFETLPAAPCHAYWDFLSRPASQGLLTKDEKAFADLFCPAA